MDSLQPTVETRAPARGRAMAAEAGREHWQSRSKRAAAPAAAPCPASPDRVLLELLPRWVS
jgi:hypothetical protein